MKKIALKSINRMINNFDLIFEKKDNYTDCALHAIIGKIGLAVELELITFEEGDRLIERLFDKYGKLERF